MIDYNNFNLISLNLFIIYYYSLVLACLCKYVNVIYFYKPYFNGIFYILNLQFNGNYYYHYLITRKRFVRQCTSECQIYVTETNAALLLFINI